MRSVLIFLLCLVASFAEAKTLTKITLLPPTTGYYLPDVNGSSIQITPLCTYDDNSTDNCSTQSLTWGTTNDPEMSVSSTGLVSVGPSFGGSISSIVRSGGYVTVTTTGTFRIPRYAPPIIVGVTDSSFNGTFSNVGNNSVPTPGNSVYFSGGVSGPNATSSGGKLYFGWGADVYAYSGTIFGYHTVGLAIHNMTSINTRPELSGDAAKDSHEVVVGSTVLLSAEDSTYTPVDGDSVGDYCAWTTSNPSIATVDNIGNVVGVSAGNANITCTIANLATTRAITVTNPTLANKTWYVRADGGTVKNSRVPSGQCDGTLNVPLAGSTGGHCAVNNPMYLITDETSTTAYTGLLGAGDTAIIVPKPDGSQYLMGGKSQNVGWIVGTIKNIPSGTPAQPTRILGSNYASCSTRSAMTKLQNYWSWGLYNITGRQNIDIECLDLGNWADCNQALSNNISFKCPVNTATSPDGFKSQFPFIADTFSSNINLKNDYVHGFTNAWTGTPGPGLVIADTETNMNWQAGLDFDNPYGYAGNRTEGFTGIGLEASYNGCTEEVPKLLSSVSRDGSGNLNVSFAPNQMVNYVVGTNLVLQDMTPSDLNGTYPVSSINFNQGSVNITGGSCDNNISSTSSLTKCVFTTSTTPTFFPGAFVHIAGATPTWLNGYYEVFDSSSTGFTVAASALNHLGWTSGAISSGGTASTSISLVATANGIAETASAVGTASHVIPSHRCEDQYDAGYADGDGVGTGGNTIGSWKCYFCKFIDNLQDGWDMLHSSMIDSVFTGSISSGNEGAPAKFGNSDRGTFTNNILIGTGGSLLAFNPNKPPDFNQYIATPYRANDIFPVSARMWSTMVVSNNTFMGGFDNVVDDGCSDANGCQSLPAFEKAVMQNNIWIGFQDTNNPSYNNSPPGMYCDAGCNNTPNQTIAWTWTNNIGFNVRNGPAGTGNNWSANPGLVKIIPDIFTLADEVKALDFSVVPTRTSIAREFSVVNADVPTVDNENNPRSSPATAGALEYQPGTLLTVTVLPNAATIFTNDTTTYAATCAYTDGGSTPCNVTWSDTNNHSSIGSTTGLVTGVSIGMDTITATLSGIYGTATVTVKNPRLYTNIKVFGSMN